MKKITLCFCILAMAHLSALAQTVTLTTSDYNGYNIGCFGSQNGSITAIVTGGTPPYTYEWSNGATTASVTNLPAGYYAVRVDDANTLTPAVDAELTLVEPEPLVIEEFKPYLYSNGYNVSAHGACNGSIAPVINGGVTPYTYLWEPGQQTVWAPTNLCAFEAVLIVTDNNGCQTNQGISLSEPERDDWQMNGNSNTNPATQFLGTTDNNDLSLRTYNLERLRVLANGNIKIDGLAGGAGMVYVDTDGTLKNANADLNAAPCSQSPSPAVWGGYSQSGTNAPLLFSCPSINVAIGSFSFPPAGFKFNVYGNSYFQSNVSIGSASTATGIRFLVTGNSYFNGDIGIGTSTFVSGFKLNVSGNSYLNGTVSIGTINLDPQYKLLVNGVIRAKKVVVEIGWSDYVFDKNYKLMTIDALDRYIAANNHLPNVPSAKEIEEKGLDVGGVQAKQMEKIEEMALYIIQLNKKIEEQDKRIAELEKTSRK